MAVESIVQTVLASRRDLTREEVIKRIEEKVKNAKGYFTHEVAAQVVASELGVQTFEDGSQHRFLINDIVSGLGDVTITGRVIHVSPSQRFVRSDGTDGAVKRLLIADKSGVIKVVLWDDKAKSAEDENVKPGRITKFSHGYVREGLDGKAELNLGSRGEIEVLPSDGLEDEYPTIESFTKKVRDITENNRRVNVLGVVQRVFPEKTFKRKEGSEGKTRHLWLEDSTGQIRVVFWNSKVEEIEDLREGSYLTIINAKVKSRFDDQVELHVEDTSNIEVSAAKPSDSTSPSTNLVKVNEIKPEMRNINLLARVAYVGATQKIDKPNDDGYFSQLLVGDETGSIQLNLWGDKASLSKQIILSDIVLIEGAYTRRWFRRLSLNLDKRGLIVINPDVKEARSIPQNIEKTVKIADISEEGYVTIQGIVATTPSVREVTTTRNDVVKVASFELSDGTGRVEVSLWRDLVENTEKLSTGDHVMIANIYVERDHSGRWRLSSSTLTSVKILSENESLEKKQRTQ